MWTLPTLCIIFVPIFPLVRFWIYREQIETRPSKSVRVWSKIFHGITTVAFFSDGLINFLLIPASPRVANGRRPLAAPASVASVGEALCFKIHFFFQVNSWVAIQRQHKILSSTYIFCPRLGTKKSPCSIGSKMLSSKLIFTKFSTWMSLD